MSPLGIAISALDRSPLTVRQLLKLSETFAYPFTTERRVQERLQRLAAAGRVRRWRYATAGQGALGYYTLSPLGFRLLHGPDAVPAGRGHFRPVGVARQAHTQALAEVIVHFHLAAHAATIPVVNFRRENTVRLHVADESLYPDTAFELHPGAASCFRYFLEIDNRSETVSVGVSLDSWGRKVQFYERHQDSRPDRFRVLLVTTGGEARLSHMLRSAAELASNPFRSLVYGIPLKDLLASEDPLHEPCFANHVEHAVALIPPVSVADPTSPLTVEPTMVPCATCLRPLERV